MSSNVRVQIVVEIEEGSWGDDCSLGQARKQACEGAIGRLRRLFEMDKDIRIVGAIETTVILIRGAVGK